MNNMTFEISGSDFGAAHRKGRKERKAQPQCGTWITRIQRIFTDTCQSVPYMKSVFYRSFSRMKSTDRKVSVFISVRPRFSNGVIFQMGLTGLIGCGFNPVHPVILSNLKCWSHALGQSSMGKGATL